MLPVDANFQMPAEWARHLRTFVAWPVRSSMCHPDHFENIQDGYSEIVQAIREFEPVTVIVNPGETDRIRRLIPVAASTHPVDFLELPHNDSWIRDSGPTILRSPDGHLAGINWQFNAWGGKYSPWDLDDALAPAILDHYGVRRFDAPLVMEGGSFHTDGEGTLLTTEECLLHPNRNPALTREQIERYLRQYLGVAKVIWLKRGLAGDETDGHVDNIACFAAPGKVLIQVCDDPADDNAEITRNNLAILARATDAMGRRLEIVPIRQPPRQDEDGQRLTLSYLNFYFVNDGIILPVFGGATGETDEKACATLAGLYPGRRIRRINGLGIISEGGNVHCATQQMTEGILK